MTENTTLSTTEAKQEQQNVLTLVQTPVDLAKESYTEALKNFKENMKKLSFVDTLYIQLDENYTKPKECKFILELYERYFCCKLIKNSTLVLTLGANFKIENAYTIIFKYNDKSGQKDLIYCVLDIKNCDGKTIKDIELKNLAKCNENRFSEAIGDKCNLSQICFSPKEFKAFWQKYVIPKLKNKIIIYKNAGLISPQSFLMGNCLISKGDVYWADANGLIKSPKANTSVKLDENFEYPRPLLLKSDKKAEIVAKDFLKNFEESWGNNFCLAILALGHIIMGLFYNKFAVQTIGAPVLIICGVSGAGKSTIVSNGISIFGLDESFLNSGDSTTRGQEGIAQSFNGISISVDDLLENILESKRFGSTIKKLFKSSARIIRKSYGQSANIIHTCSQIVYSTNGKLPQVPELINRSNIVEFKDITLDVEKFKYLEENPDNKRELSLILPELLKNSEETVLKIHTELKEFLDQNLGKTTMPRLTHNIAYMWTGVKLLEQVAGYEIENFSDMVLEYAKDVKRQYEEIPNPLDMLLSGLLTLKQCNQIEKGTHYKILSQDKTDDANPYIEFHKDTLLTIYNKFFSHEETKRISHKLFDIAIATDKRVVRSNITGYYKGKRKNSILVNIIDWDDAEEFTGEQIVHFATPAASLRQCNKE